jgi:uncharacterized lipoprotein
MFHIKAILTVCAVLALAACSDRYRYPCQDPANQGLEECSPAICAVTDMCPSKLETPVVETPQEPVIEKEGDCK